MEPLNYQNQTTTPEPSTHLPGDFHGEVSVDDAAKVLAWEMIENGRYRPRRIKGSLLGRDLG